MPVKFVVQSAGEDSSRCLLDATKVMDKPSSLSVERFGGDGGCNTAKPKPKPTAPPHANYRVPLVPQCRTAPSPWESRL